MCGERKDLPDAAKVSQQRLSTSIRHHEGQYGVASRLSGEEIACVAFQAQAQSQTVSHSTAGFIQRAAPQERRKIGLSLIMPLKIFFAEYNLVCSAEEKA